MCEDNFSTKVYDTLARYEMLPRGCTVLTGVSGGADSTALLYWLATHAQELEVQVMAAHLHHGLRGAEADRDEAFVRHLCSKLAVPLHVLHLDVRAEAQKTGEGLEECGRRLRYAFFYKICENYPNMRIATAHTLSDNAETMLLNLARGAGAAGLSGIPPMRGTVIRPLLEVTRTETETYCRAYGLNFMTDSTNADTTFARNRVRACIVPELKHLAPAFEQAAGRAARALREDNACLCTLARQALAQAQCPGGWQAHKLAAQPRAVRVRALRQAAKSAGAGQLEQRHLEQLDALLTVGGGCMLPGNCLARVEQGILLFPRQTLPYCVPLELPQMQLPDGRLLCLQVLPYREYEAKKEKFIFSNVLNYDTINTDTVVRTRKSGDTFTPAGRGVRKTLKKLLNEQHIPASLRPQLALLADHDGILWAEGCGASERARVTATASRVAVVTIKESV